MFLHLFMLIVSRGQDFFYTPYILTGIKDNLCCKKVARLNERDIFLRCKVDISVNLYGQNLNQFSDSRSVHPCCNVHMSLNNCDTASSLYSRLAVAARRGRRANTLIIPIWAIGIFDIFCKQSKQQCVFTEGWVENMHKVGYTFVYVCIINRIKSKFFFLSNF